MKHWQWLFLTILLFSASVLGQGASDLLLERKHVWLCRERDSNLRPFFRVTLNVKDRSGNIQGIKLDDKTLLEQIKVQGVKGNSYANEQFVVLAVKNATDAGSAVATAAAPGRTILLLFDVSGSMVEKKNYIDGKSRLEVAKVAAKVMLGNFRDGVDRIAIVPFESHQVEASVKNATFAEARKVAEARIDQLSQSDVRNANTALYSATAFALDKLQRESQAQQPLLVVLTDGKNDVHPDRGDDRDLWQDEGLEKVREKARQSNIPIWTIGFGTAGQDFDPDKLQQMVYPEGNQNYFPAENEEQIKGILKTVEQALSSNLVVTFFLPRVSDYRTINKLDFQVTLPDGTASKPLSWASASASGVSFEKNLEEYEVAAALNNTRLKSSGSPVSPWQQLLRTLGILALFSGGFTLLWFLPPRLLWPPSVPSKLKLPSRLSQKKAPTPIPPKPRPSVSAASLPAKPRQRFEETRIFKEKDLKSGR